MPWLADNSKPCWLGLDVGGANLKVADGLGRAVSVPFALWKAPDRLGGEVATLLERVGGQRVAGVALTMTGELADCYATKAEGVRAIVQAVTGAAGGLPVQVATVDDRWIAPDAARQRPDLVAAANWRVAARLVAANRPEGAGLWLDVGSTTIDAIPIRHGRVESRGASDPERLVAGELVYSGARRTPVCALVDHLPYRGGDCPVAAEWFATTADAWLLLGELPEDEGDYSTADGRSLTRRHAIARVARCVCADETTFNESDALAAAERVAAAQVWGAARAIGEPKLDWLVCGGEGTFLASRIANALDSKPSPEPIESSVGSDASRSFPAHACAVLAQAER